MLVGLAGLAGCHSDDTTLTHSLAWHQDANNEIQDCHTFKLDNADPVEIDRITVNFPPGSHHVHIYRSDTPEDDGVADCFAGIDWLRWHLVLGVQTQPMDWSLPPGLTVPLDAHQQLLVQVHWLNATPDPIDRQIDIGFHVAERSDAHVGVMFGVNKQTAMQPHEHKVLRQWCAMPTGAQLIAMMGHYHGLGQHYSAWSMAEHATSGSLIYDALDDDTFQFKLFDPAYTITDGSGLEFECDFFNTRDIATTWGSDTRRQEHCNMVAYYYPAEEISKFCIIEITEVSAITGPAAAPRAGESATYTVDLSAPALAGGATVELASSDPTILAVADRVFVAEGQQTITFNATALRPGRATVTATLGSVSRDATTAVGGLVLSEVHLGISGQGNRRQWVELANTSNVAIDLSRYSLGAGRADYTETRQPLHVMLPPRGCVVVGGPELTSVDQPPYDDPFDFDPSLGFGSGTEANGIAVFDLAADHIVASSVPLDTLVYGTDNNTLVDPTANIAAPVPPLAGDGSYYRPSETQWQTQLVPTPSICEVR